MMKFSSLLSRLTKPFAASVESTELAAKRKQRWVGLDTLEDRKMLSATLGATVPSFPLAGTYDVATPMFASVLVSNTGIDASLPFTVKLYRSRDNAFGVTDTLLDADVVNTLSAGNSTAIQFQWDATVADANDEAVPDGTASTFLIAVIDQELTNGAAAVTPTAAADYTVRVPTITVLADPDLALELDKSASDLFSTEGDLKSGKIVLSRSGITSYPLTVNYQLTGSASPADFDALGAAATYTATPVNATATFAANSATATVTFSPIVDNNATNENAGENVVLTVTASSAPLTYTATAATRTLAVADTVPTIALAVTDGLLAEKTTNTGMFRVSRTPGDDLTQPVVVRLTMSGGAVLGTDYVTSGVTFDATHVDVTIPANRSSVNLRITPIDDVAVEAIVAGVPTQEFVTITVLADPTTFGRYAGAGASASMELIDNDTVNLYALVTAPTQNFTVPTNTHNQTLRFTVVISNASSSDSRATTLKVKLLGSAVAGSDAAAFNNAANITLQTINISGIHAGRTVRKTITIRLGSISGLAADTYRAAAHVDDAGAITEPVETDNYGFSAAVITVA